MSSERILSNKRGKSKRENSLGTSSFLVLYVVTYLFPFNLQLWSCFCTKQIMGKERTQSDNLA